MDDVGQNVSWEPIETAPVDGTEVLVRRLEFDAEGGLQAAWHAVASWWVGLWVFHYAATSQPTQLRFVPTEWQPIDDELGAGEEDDDATGIGEAAQGDAGSSSGQVDAGDPAQSGS